MDADNGFRPPGLIRISTTEAEVADHAPGLRQHLRQRDLTHHSPCTGRRAARWSSAPAPCSGPTASTTTTSPTADAPTDPRMQQATRQPACRHGRAARPRESGLVSGVRVDRHPAPASRSPARRGHEVPIGAPVTIAGTASTPVAASWPRWRCPPTGGPPGTRPPAARRGASVHPGVSRRPRRSWSGPSTTAATSGSAARRRRSGIAACPCSIWPAGVAPRTPAVDDTSAVELG